MRSYYSTEQPRRLPVNPIFCFCRKYRLLHGFLIRSLHDHIDQRREGLLELVLKLLSLTLAQSPGVDREGLVQHAFDQLILSLCNLCVKLHGHVLGREIHADGGGVVVVEEAEVDAGEGIPVEG